MTPPPTTTTRAWAGMLAGLELAALKGNGCPGQKRNLGIIVRMLRAWLAVAVRLAAVAAPSGRKLECISGIRCGYIKARCAEHHTIERDLVLHFTDGFRMRGLM